jgi:hypothetical protein
MSTSLKRFSAAMFNTASIRVKKKGWMTAGDYG